jgi:anti-sigma factor RsiW
MSSTSSRECTYAPELSSLVDGELLPADVPAAVEHLLGCDECATFFRRSRALDAALLLAAAGDGDALEPAPPRVWQRIGAEVGGAGRGRGVVASTAPPRRRLPVWAAPLAASLLLVAGAGGGWWLARSERAVPTGFRELAHAGRVLPAAATAPTPSAGEMTEERFVAIARELLAADRRYRDAMAGVLVVADSEAPREGSTAESAWREEELRTLEPPRPDGARLY